MEKKLPAIRKTISSYISEENGRITKHSVLSLGAILAAAAIASLSLKGVSGQTHHSHSHLSSPPPPPVIHASY